MSNESNEVSQEAENRLEMLEELQSSKDALQKDAALKAEIAHLEGRLAEAGRENRKNGKRGTLDMVAQVEIVKARMKTVHASLYHTSLYHIHIMQCVSGEPQAVRRLDQK